MLVCSFQQGMSAHALYFHFAQLFCPLGLTGASPNNLLYIDGTPNKKISNEDLVDELEEQVRSKISKQKIESEKIILRS